MTGAQEDKLDALITEARTLTRLVKALTHEVSLNREEAVNHGKNIADLMARVSKLESQPPKEAA